MTEPDPHNLRRFVDAQCDCYATVVAELRKGRKRSHWMWFIFPQVAGLGHSPTARFFAIGSRMEARAYLAHPQLGQRLLECTRLVSAIEGATANDIFGFPDDLKFRSSMTLFASVADDATAFDEALQRFFSGQPDARTVELLR